MVLETPWGETNETEFAARTFSSEILIFSVKESDTNAEIYQMLFL